jgi:hypothetical protein
MIVTIAVASTWIACGGGAMNKDKDAEANRLALVARAPADLALGGAMAIEITLRNTSSQPILVNGRMLVDEASGLPGRHELEPSLVGPDGKPLAFMQDVNAPEAAASDLVELAPGAVVTRKLALDHYFRPAAPGTYRLEVVYRNDRALEREGRRAFVGQVRATPIELVIR